MAKLWGGRFKDNPHELMEQLGESVSIDARLAPWDIRASIAHAHMLGGCGILSKRDTGRIVSGLKRIMKSIEKGAFVWETSLEDVHTNIESALVLDIGDIGKKLHTARSRNDQVATDTRLWLRDQIDHILTDIRKLQGALVSLAEKNIHVIIPGFTHLQQAQPVLLAHHLLAYFEMLQRDHERIVQLRKRVNVLPLGAAALAGTPFPIDRHQVAEELGFEKIADNSMDAVSDRDYLIEFCSDAAMVMMHLSRLAEELILWSSSSFNFIEISDEFTTGSSIMPQKKNPDAAEIVRGKTGRVYGSLIALLTAMKGLPLTYNRDLQEDKGPVFDTVDTLQLCLNVFGAMMPGIVFKEAAIKNALTKGFMEATDLADYLAGKGVPFRKAHEIVGTIVQYCIKHDTVLPLLSLDELKRFSSVFEADVLDVLTPESLVERRDNPGATAPRRVRAALRKAKKRCQAR